MDLKQLEYFIMIAEMGNITAAAKKLHISQPPLSIQLKRLEEELGTALFERKPRSVALTDAGQLLYQYAIQILMLSDTAKNAISDFKDGISGTLRLGTISSSGGILLNGCMAEYCRQNPNIRFQIHEGTTFELLDILLKNIIEIAVVRTPFLLDGVTAYFLEKEPMVLAGHARYFSQLPPTIKVSDLKEIPLIIYRRYKTLLDSVMQDKKVVPQILCENDDARTCILWAREGLGVTIIPKSASKIIVDAQLLIKDIDEPEWNTTLAVIHRKGVFLSKAAQSFIQVFLQSFQEIV